MKLELKGVGALHDAEILLNGLTVILGENGSGKSTILRSLYCIADTPLHFDDKKISEVHNSVDDLMFRSRRKTGSSPKDLSSIRHKINDLIDAGDIDSAMTELRLLLQNNEDSEPSSEEILHTIERVLNGQADDELINSMAKDDVEDEFSNARQMRSLSSNTEASAIISEGDASFGIRISTDDECIWSGSIDDHFPSVIYYDTPFILDDVSVPYRRRRMSSNHRDDMISKLNPRRDMGLIDEMIAKSHAERFYKVIRTVIDGEFQRNIDGLDYIDSNGMRMNASNLAAGAKVFAILELLANNGLLSRGSLVLLDEPEVHLHPGWINILARLIVLLRKDIGARVVMTTHSPQLLLAVQAISMEYDVHADYYSLSRNPSGECTVTDLHGDLLPVYTLMSKYFQEADLMYRRSADDDD